MAKRNGKRIFMEAGSRGLLLLAVTIVCCSQALASDNAPPSADVAETIRKAKVLNQDYPVHVIISNQDATVLTRRHYKATDDDLKIDAVLVAKAVLDKYGDKLDRVKVLFRDEDSTSGKAVSVTETDIKNYANGTMEPQQFLATLALKRVDGDPEAEKLKNDSTDQGLVASPGPYQEQRLLLLDRINTLRKRGTGVAPFEKIFSELDKNASAGQTDAVKAGIRDLGGRLSEQEELVRQAARVVSGRGIRGSQSGSSYDSSSRNQRFGSGFGANSATTVSTGSKPGATAGSGTWSGTASSSGSGSQSSTATTAGGSSSAGWESYGLMKKRIIERIIQMGRDNRDVEPYKRELYNIESKFLGGNESARGQAGVDLKNLARQLNVDESAPSRPADGSATEQAPPGRERPFAPFRQMNFNGNGAFNQ